MNIQINGDKPNQEKDTNYVTDKGYWFGQYLQVYIKSFLRITLQFFFRVTMLGTIKQQT